MAEKKTTKDKVQKKAAAKSAAKKTTSKKKTVASKITARPRSEVETAWAEVHIPTGSTGRKIVYGGQMTVPKGKTMEEVQDEILLRSLGNAVDFVAKTGKG